jgi:acetoin utilization deacetylase AcuC-like enzyme
LTTGYVWLQQYAWHDTGTQHILGAGRTQHPLPHFESPDSKSRLASLVEATGLGDHLDRLPVTPVTDEDVLRVHTAGYLARLRRDSLAPKGGDAGDDSTPFGHGGLEIARLAAGGAAAIVDAALTGRVVNGYALVRPPGHHAVADAGMGFCLLANIAIAIRRARAALGVERVAVVDWDVHHGNGTQALFWEDPATLAISLHQDNLYPFGSGTLEQRGGGAGFGTTLNVPLPAGSGNGAYEAAIRGVVTPALHRFRPELIIVASGFDGSFLDPFGRMMITTSGYRAMTRQLMAAAEELCGGRLVMVHEGGYNTLYVPYCGLAVIETLAGVDTGVAFAWDEDWDRLPDQALQPRQAAVIAQAAAQAAEVPATAATRAEAVAS